MQRLSLRSALVGIALLSLGFGAIVSQSRLAASTAYSAFWLANLIALCGTLVARGAARATCVGGVVFGLGYWMLAFEAEHQQPSATAPRIWSVNGMANWLVPASAWPEPPGARLLTAELIDWFEEAVRPRLAPGVKVSAQYNGGAYYLGKIQSYRGGDYVIAWDDGTAPSPVAPGGIRGHVAYIRTSAHSVVGLLTVFVGGLIARFLFIRLGSSGERREAGST